MRFEGSPTLNGQGPNSIVSKGHSPKCIGLMRFLPEKQVCSPQIWRSKGRLEIQWIFKSFRPEKVRFDYASLMVIPMLGKKMLEHCLLKRMLLKLPLKAHTVHVNLA